MHLQGPEHNSVVVEVEMVVSQDNMDKDGKAKVYPNWIPTPSREGEHVRKLELPAKRPSNRTFFLWKLLGWNHRNTTRWREAPSLPRKLLLGILKERQTRSQCPIVNSVTVTSSQFLMWTMLDDQNKIKIIWLWQTKIF